MSVEKQLPPPQFRDLTELGEELGLNNLNSLYAEIKDGRLAAYKFGKAWKVPVEEYERYLEEVRDVERWYDLDDLARSVQVTMKYLYGEIKERRLHAFKLGKGYKVKPEEWQRYLKTKKSSQNDESSDDEEE
jgi:hypothetical protein